MVVDLERRESMFVKKIQRGKDFVTWISGLSAPKQMESRKECARCCRCGDSLPDGPELN